MRLKFKEELNELITNRVDLGEIVYTSKKINDSHTESNLHDVYTRPSVYKQNAWYDIKNDCKDVHGYGLHITSYNVNFFSTCFYTRLGGVLYAIVDKPSRRIAYTNDSRFDFTGVKVRVYGCEDKWTRDRIRNLVKPYLCSIGIKKGRVDYIGFDDEGYKFYVNNFKMTEKNLELYNLEYYRTQLWKE